MEALSWIGNEVNRSLEAAGLDGASRAHEQKLRHVCKEFETVLASSLIKNSLKASMTTGWDDESDGNSANNGYMDMVHSNLGKYIGEQGLLGLADSLYEQLSQFQNPESKL